MVISKPLPSTTDEDVVYQLYCQTLLLEVMFYEVNERVKLPQRAINSIAHVIERIDGLRHATILALENAGEAVTIAIF